MAEGEGLGNERGDGVLGFAGLVVSRGVLLVLKGVGNNGVLGVERAGSEGVSWLRGEVDGFMYSCEGEGSFLTAAGLTLEKTFIRRKRPIKK